MKKNMMRNIYLLLVLTMMMAQGSWAQDAQGLTGTGTSGDPYQINNQMDWITFATNVTNGNRYEGEFVKLTADIMAYAMAGDMSTYFMGTFDGGDHTITFNIIKSIKR
jgi:hypothetical protein